MRPANTANFGGSLRKQIVSMWIHFILNHYFKWLGLKLFTAQNDHLQTLHITSLSILVSMRSSYDEASLLWLQRCAVRCGGSNRHPSGNNNCFVRCNPNEQRMITSLRDYSCILTLLAQFINLKKSVAPMLSCCTKVFLYPSHAPLKCPWWWYASLSSMQPIATPWNV